MPCSLFPRAGRGQCRLPRRWCHRAKEKGGCCSRSWELPRPGSRRSGRWCFANIPSKLLVDLFAGIKQLKCPAPQYAATSRTTFVHEGMTCTGKGFAPVLHPSLRIMRKSPGTARKRTGDASLRQEMRSGRIVRDFTLHGMLSGPRGIRRLSLLVCPCKRKHGMRFQAD